MKDHELFAVQIDLLDVWRKRVRDHNLNTVLLYLLVVASVAPANVGVDRHLSVFGGSIRHADQIDGCASAFLLDMLQGFVRKIQIHL